MPKCRECGEDIYFITNDEGTVIPIHPSGSCGYMPAPRRTNRKYTAYNDISIRLQADKPTITRLPSPEDCESLLMRLNRRSTYALKQIVAFIEYPPKDLDADGEKALQILRAGVATCEWIHQEIKVLPTKVKWWDQFSHFSVSKRRIRKG